MDKALRILGLVCVLILVANQVMALGVSPAKLNIDFEPGNSEDVSFRIINNERKNLKATIYAEGELADYVSFDQNIIEVPQDAEMQSVKFRVDLPQRIDTPGTHEVKIIVLELPEQFADASKNTVVTDQGPVIFPSKSGDSMITATVAVVTKLLINVPYPGTFLTADMIIQEADVGKTVHFTLPVSNFGTQDLQRVSARIKILTPTYEEIAEIETNEIPLQSKQKSRITGQWKADVNAGTYIARAIVTYDGETISLEKQFNVGSLLLEIEDVVVNDFILGGVARFDILVESFWNEVIKDVFGEMVITDKQGNEMSRFKSAVIDVDPLAKGNIQAYWDTQGVKVGLYDVNLIVHYAGKTVEKTMEIQVDIDKISTDLAAGAATGDKGLLTRDTILIVSIAILVVINIGWMVYVMKRRRNRE